MVDPDRTIVLQKGTPRKGPVVYWMSRDQRALDNWALLFAGQRAREKNTEYAVVFTLVPEFLEAGLRQYHFMLQGLRETGHDLARLNIPFIVLSGDPPTEMAKFINSYGVSEIVTDFDPLRIKRSWKTELLKKIDIPVYETDAHNIVPCRIASKKKEFAAYTIRPRISRQLNRFLTDIPAPEGNRHLSVFRAGKQDWTATGPDLPRTDHPTEQYLPKTGPSAARLLMNEFIANRLHAYQSERNDPLSSGVSGLSPYLHFGQISSQRIAFEISTKYQRDSSSDAFLEELVIRKELSDNYCHYQSRYDHFSGFPDWARKTLNDHRRDERAFVYPAGVFESADTHDELWNAAQNEMVITGRMHGYTRMYWAKKILEWTPSPEEALRTSIYLNDKYQLDGRDPNGYTGCAWSIGGVHDRAWKERPVFGKIRYMNEAGCRRKFDVEGYIRRIKDLSADRNKD